MDGLFSNFLREELATKKEKVIDVALKYGYENPDSFARAFSRFHGATPSQARRGGIKLKSVSMLSVKEILERNRKAGEITMEYRIEEKPEMVLTGYKRHFTGVPLATKEYANQSEDFYVHTRMNQMVLRYMSVDRTMTIDYNIIDHLDEEGYDFWIAEQLTAWYHTHLAEDTVLGEDAKRFEDMVIPARKYAVFETEQCAYPTMKHVELRRRIAEEWLPTSGFMLADAPEINVIHWYREPNKDKRYIELWLPVEEKYGL